MAYLEHARVAQPPTNISKHCYGVIGPECQRVPIKIISVKVKIEHLNVKKL